ncbi:dienelactone hydrolase family protein [Novosphingobium piscinae]|uniref:Dienelactone hydrolase family protein n=1 Tax=Novosphingobium piscinae TaxID=1507448 RepID=A0A7X1FZX7_9SPHN|nr:dienelactone hydrolase family protein [Novosphingobium piscinae]MBC2669427.1 dienelactone hydrolase family protein [Novosphingobium piscinae]
MSALAPIEYADRGTALTGWLARPAGPARAAILVWPTIANVTPAIERRARMLADAGYVAMIGDFYGEPVADFAASFPLAGALRADVDHYRTRLLAGLAALRGLPEAAGLPAAAIGFCMGGQAALELARLGADLAFVASFHGVFETARPADPGAAHKPRVLVLHGDADPLAPRDKVIALWDELDAAGFDWHFHAYAKVRHGFTDPGSDQRGMDALGYDASADRQSWAALLRFAEETFG